MSPGSGPIDHSGHASLMSALLSASSVGGREPPLRSCRFEAVNCRNREDMSTPNYPLRPLRSTDSPWVDRRFLLGSFAGLTLHSGISAVRSIFTALGDSLTISVAQSPGASRQRAVEADRSGGCRQRRSGRGAGLCRSAVDRCQFRIRLRITLGLHRAVTLSRGSVGRQAVADLTTPS